MLALTIELVDFWIFSQWMNLFLFSNWSVEISYRSNGWRVCLDFKCLMWMSGHANKWLTQYICKQLYTVYRICLDISSLICGSSTITVAKKILLSTQKLSITLSLYIFHGWELTPSLNISVNVNHHFILHFLFQDCCNDPVPSWRTWDAEDPFGSTMKRLCFGLFFAGSGR